MSRRELRLVSESRDVRLERRDLTTVRRQFKHILSRGFYRNGITLGAGVFFSEI